MRCSRPLLALLSAHLTIAAAPPACLPTSPDHRVSLSGRIERQDANGPPNYGEDPGQDRKESFLQLVLDTPICVFADQSDGPSERIRTLELAVTNGSSPALAGRRAIVTGTLYHAHTGHHHTPVLIAVEQIQAP
jgi:hypothetical protein